MKQKLRRYSAFLFCMALYFLFTGFDAHVQAQQSLRSFISGGLAWSPDGSRIAVATNDGVWIHQADNLDNVQHVIEANNIASIAWHPVENWIATGSRASQEHNPLRIWDAETGRLLHVLVGHQLAVNNLKWSPDGQLLASKSWDETIRIWSAANFQEVRVINTPQADSQPLMDWSPDSRFIVTMHEENVTTYRIYIYDAQTGQVKQSWDFDVSTSALEWSPDNRFVAGVGRGRDGLGDMIRIWDAATGRHLNSIRVNGQSLAMQWSPDSTQFVLYLSTRINDIDYNRLVMVDVQEEERLTESSIVEMRGVGDYANAIAYSPDGTQIASISDDGRLLIFSAHDLSLLSSYDGYRSLLNS